MATHSSALAWKIPWTAESGRLQSMGSLGVGHDWATSFHFSLSCIGEGNGNPLQCSCLENPRDRGAWRVSVCGVAQSQTQLKWLSSSSSEERRKSILEGMNGSVQSPDTRDILGQNGSCKNCWVRWLEGDFTIYVVKLRTSFNLSFTFFICKIVIKWYLIHRITRMIKWISNAWHIIFWKDKLSLLNV